MAEIEKPEPVELRSNRAALAIEDAETRILRLSREAVLYMFSREKYKKRVDEIIEDAKSGLPEELKERIVKPLRDYATRQIVDQRRLLAVSVAMYGSLFGFAKNAVTMDLRDRQADFSALFGKDYTDAPGFTEEFDKIKTPDWGNKSAYIYDEAYRDRRDRVERLTAELVARNAREEYETNVNLRNIAEMTVRYDGQIKMIDEMKERGVDLVWIEPHANCSERCEPYQGKLYSISGRSGRTADGRTYRPLSYATENPRDQYITKAGKVYQNGCITGFNCRHRLIPYRESQTVEQIPADVVERRRVINDQQRAYERKIRQYKRRAVQAGRSKDGAEYRQRAKVLTERYKDFCLRNKVWAQTDRLKAFEE